MKKSITFIVGTAAVMLSWLGVSQQQSDTNSKNTDLCVKPASGPINAESNPQKVDSNGGPAAIPIARVNRPAPDFEANAFADGGFKQIKLSDYKGKWVVLCFYPGDFTFV